MATAATNPEEEPLRVATGVKELRQERSWSHERLGREAGISKQTVINTEFERTQPDLKTLQAFARAFRLSLGDFLNECALRDSNPRPCGPKFNTILRHNRIISRRNPQFRFS